MQYGQFGTKYQNVLMFIITSTVFIIYLNSFYFYRFLFLENNILSETLCRSILDTIHVILSVLSQINTAALAEESNGDR